MATDLVHPEQGRAAFLRALLDAGHLIACDVLGVYGRGGEFERVIEGFERYVTQRGSDLPSQVMRFGPIMSRRAYQQTDHAETMPQLMGSVHSFTGDDKQWLELTERIRAGQPWTDALSATDVMLVPAACYPLYPTMRGSLAAAGRTIDLRAFVFRHEPSTDPARMQSFRQREYVRVGTAEQARAHRELWLERGLDMLRQLGVNGRAVVANDPFFGRGGRVMRATQREQELKFEIVVPLTSEQEPTAVISSNYHVDHFGLAFGIHTADGAPAHSACVGFGLERIALALFRSHGMDTSSWPSHVRGLLSLTDLASAETTEP